MKAKPPQSGRSKKPRGAILIGVLIILLTITLLGSTLASFFISVTTIADIELARAQSLYLAEGGIARALYELHQASILGTTTATSYDNVPLGPGTYSVTHDIYSGVITSIGKSQGVERVIQIKYRLF